jgi:hypothetical protein
MNTLKAKKDPNMHLYPNALYIYHAYTNNWPSVATLKQKMGVLDQLVSLDLKKIISPLEQPMYTRSWQKLRQLLGPYMHNIRTFGYISAGIGVGAIGYTLLKKLPSEHQGLVPQGLFT